MKIPEINWIPFDKDNPPDIPVCMYGETRCLILFRESMCDYYDSWWYHVDVATPNGSYLDSFWDTETDWYEGRKIEVLAYAELPYYMNESELMEV